MKLKWITPYNSSNVYFVVLVSEICKIPDSMSSYPNDLDVGAIVFSMKHIQALVNGCAIMIKVDNDGKIEVPSFSD